METGPSKHRLLLVDGDPKSLRVLEVSLKKAGFDVATATRGSEALAALQAAPPDLIIADTDLDGMDGFDLCRQIKAKPERAKIPFLLISGRKSIEDKIRGLELGVEDYLTKPIYIKEIAIRVRTALQRAERERLESRREGRTKFTGNLSDIGVVDLVQTIDLNRKSGIIHIVNRDGRRGAVFFRDGRVIDAEVGRLSGAEAMYRLFSWSDGRFEVDFKPIRRADVIDLPSAALLMEGMRRLDEWTRLLEKLPALDSVVEVDFRVLAEQLADLPDEMNGLLRLCDGNRSLLAVIDDSDYPDLEALTVASKLLDQGIIYAREPPGLRSEAEPGGELARWLAEGNGEEAAPAEEPSAASRPGAQAEGRFTDTLTGNRRGFTHDVQSSGERQAGKTHKAFSLHAPPFSVDTPPPAHGVEGASIEPDKRTSSQKPAGHTLRLDVGLPGQDAASSQPATPAPAMKTAADKAGVGAKPDTLRGIPIPESIAEEDQAGLDRPSVASDADRPARTTIEFVARQGAVAPGASPIEASVARPPGETARETDWGGWAQGAGRPPVTATAPRPVTVTAAEASAAATRSQAGPSQELPALAPEVGHESPRPSDEPPEVEQSIYERPTAERTLVLSEDQRIAARLSAGLSLDKLDSDLLPHERRWPLFVVAFALLVAAGLLALRTSSKASRSSPESPPATAQISPILAPIDAHQGTGNRGAAESVDQVPGSQPTVVPVAAAKPVTAPAEAQPKLPNPAGPEPANQPGAVAGGAPNRAADGQSPAAALDTPATPGLGERCRKADAGGKGRPTAVLAACRPAIEAEPEAADIMVMLARVELERGRAAEARSWAKKALAIKPDLADAYAFLGGAEQEVGNENAAKVAYKKYLELAPNGRHASELRAVLDSM